MFCLACCVRPYWTGRNKQSHISPHTSLTSPPLAIPPFTPAFPVLGNSWSSRPPSQAQGRLTALFVPDSTETSVLPPLLHSTVMSAGCPLHSSWLRTHSIQHRPWSNSIQLSSCQLSSSQPFSRPCQSSHNALGLSFCKGTVTALN